MFLFDRTLHVLYRTWQTRCKQLPVAGPGRLWWIWQERLQKPFEMLYKARISTSRFRIQANRKRIGDDKNGEIGIQGRNDVSKDILAFNGRVLIWWRRIELVIFRRSGGKWIWKFSFFKRKVQDLNCVSVDCSNNRRRSVGCRARSRGLDCRSDQNSG